MKITNVILLILLLSTSCYYNKDIYLSFIEKQSEISQPLKTKGYYYFEYEKRDQYTQELVKIVHPLHLYSDGTFKYYWNFVSGDSFSEAHKIFQNHVLKYPSHLLSHPVGWGEFRTSADSLYFMYYAHGPGNFHDYALVNGNAVITSDSSFILLSFNNLETGYKVNQNKKYVFKKYSIKPDSNNVIKEWSK